MKGTGKWPKLLNAYYVIAELLDSHIMEEIGGEQVDT